jgi:hypothetical protein
VKLLRFEASGGPRLGVLVGDEVSAWTASQVQYPTMLSIVAGGDGVAGGSLRSVVVARTVPFKLPPAARPYRATRQVSCDRYELPQACRGGEAVGRSRADPSILV